MHIVDKPVDDSLENRSTEPVSPYLQRPLRSLDEVLLDRKNQRLPEGLMRSDWTDN